MVAVAKDLTDKIDAVTLVRAGSAALGGKGGGGRPDMAQAGGPDGSKAEDAFKAIAAEIARLKHLNSFNKKGRKDPAFFCINVLIRNLQQLSYWCLAYQETHPSSGKPDL